MEETQEKKAYNQPKITPQKIEFMGKVIEVHSGDSLTIQSIKTGKTGRFFLSNVRAPQYSKNYLRPYSFESKEFLRKTLIGKEVKVLYEYEKQFLQGKNTQEQDQFEQNELRSLAFAQIWDGETNIGQLMIENGLASLNHPHVKEEEFTSNVDLLSEAEAKAKKAQIELHQPGQYSYPKFNDLTQSKYAQQASVLQFLKDHKKLTGNVELVLNGSKLKVRVNEQSCQIMVLLKGIRCLPNDSNIPEYETWSNKALKYTKENLLQRDINLNIDNIDKKGNFFGTVFLGKQDYAAVLISQGYAVTYGKQGQEYEVLEQEAKAKKVGIWGVANLNISMLKGSTSGDRNIKSLDEKKQMILSEIVSLNEFYLQVPNNPILKDIENKLENFDKGIWEKMKRPVKKGTPCIALFDGDNRFYRAIVEKEMQNKNYLVFFQDYGNYDQVEIFNMVKMPDSLINIPPQAQKSALAYAFGPSKKHPLFEDGALELKSQAWNKKLTVHQVYQEENTIYSILYVSKDETEPAKSINASILKKGYAKLDKQIKLPEQYQSFAKFESQAKDKKLKIWNYDDEDEDQDQ